MQQVSLQIIIFKSTSDFAQRIKLLSNRFVPDPWMALMVREKVFPFVC